MDGITEPVDEAADIVASPVTDILETTLISTEIALIRYLLTCNGIRIEVIVNVYSIHIITAHNVVYNLAVVVSGLFQSWIENELASIGKCPVGMQGGDMTGGERGRPLGLSPERIDPGVQLHATFVALLDHPLQRIPVRQRGTALLPCKITAPWFQVTLVERIALRAYLEDDGIDAVSFQYIKLPTKFLLDRLRGHPYELSVDALDPSTTELPFLSIRYTGEKQDEKK